MTHEKILVWAFLLTALSVLLVHICVLWRSLFDDSLRVDLLALESALVTAIPAAARSQGALRRLHALLANSRRFAGSLTFSRLLLARMILPSSTRIAPSCRHSLLNLQDGLSRETSLSIHAAFERLVARRIAARSPLLWGYILFQWAASPHAPQQPALVPWMELLEYTFDQSVDTPRPEIETIGA